MKLETVERETKASPATPRRARGPEHHGEGEESVAAAHVVSSNPVRSRVSTSEDVEHIEGYLHEDSVIRERRPSILINRRASPMFMGSATNNHAPGVATPGGASVDFSNSGHLGFPSSPRYATPRAAAQFPVAASANARGLRPILTSVDVEDNSMDQELPDAPDFDGEEPVHGDRDDDDQDISDVERSLDPLGRRLGAFAVFALLSAGALWTLAVGRSGPNERSSTNHHEPWIIIASALSVLGFAAAVASAARRKAVSRIYRSESMLSNVADRAYHASMGANASSGAGNAAVLPGLVSYHSSSQLLQPSTPQKQWAVSLVQLEVADRV